MFNKTMDQLQPLDSLFLDLESEQVQANIGGMTVFEGPAPSYAELAAKIESRLELTPRFRRRLRFLPMRLTGPVWVDYADFALADHLLPDRTRVADLDRLRQEYADFAARRLDREKPLWQVRIFDGLPGGKWALGWKVHHAMVDGLAATELLKLLLDFEPDPELREPSPWRPEPPPSRREVLARTLIGPEGPAGPIRDLGRAIRRPRRSARRARDTLKALIPVGRSLVASHHSPLNGPIGPRRRWANARVDLGDVKLVGKTLGGTVNDVVLAAVAAGVRELLVRRGTPLSGFDARAMVPVSVRTDPAGAEDNRVSAVFIELPVDVSDPVERIARVREQMDRLKRERGETMGEVLFDLAGYLPPPIWRIGESIAWRVADTQRLMNTIITNVPGPQIPLYCLGRELLELYPYVMLAKNIRLATAAFSYRGNVFFGITGDYETVADVEVVALGIEREISALLAIAAERAHPASASRRSEASTGESTAAAGTRDRTGRRRRARRAAAAPAGRKASSTSVP